MGKSAHGPRGAAKRSAPLIGAEDSSYIVFSNAKGDPKKPKETSAPDAAKSKLPAAGDLNAPEAPKKPDMRSLIGGASWTGKLPVNMLNEHCQKQKWEKPEYTMVLGTFIIFSCLYMLRIITAQGRWKVLVNGDTSRQEPQNSGNHEPTALQASPDP